MQNNTEIVKKDSIPITKANTFNGSIGFVLASYNRGAMTNRRAAGLRFNRITTLFPRVFGLQKSESLAKEFFAKVRRAYL